MELNTKVKELEDEIKVLKAEIRNVLLDIREVVLDKTNPLAEEHESAFMRLDLNTTARSIAADAAANAAAPPPAVAAAPPPAVAAEEPKDAGAGPEDDEPKDVNIGADEPSDSADTPSKGKGSRKGKGKGSKPDPDEETAAPEDAPPDGAEIPTMYRAPARPGSTDVVSLAAWVADAMGAVGPQQVDRVITIHRLCGTLAPNISEALTHLQELIRSSSEEEQSQWLKVLQDLDKLASS